MSKSLTWTALSQKYLELNLIESARFYAERAWYQTPSEDNVYQLAQCYYREGKIKQTYLILQDSKFTSHKASKYLFAMSCLSLGKLEEGERILLPGSRFMSLDNINSETFLDIPGEAAGVFLLGKICKRQQRKEMARKCFEIAFEVSF
jgi:tetratricopeptide (TPR) repeat protein